jgi:hypothetical protein
MMRERGPDVDHSTVFRWVQPKFVESLFGAAALS